MNTTVNDGIRSAQLAAVGIHTEVLWHPDDTVTITAPTATLDQIIRSLNVDRQGVHYLCGDYDEEDLDAARDEGWKNAIDAMEEFAASKKSTAA
jgi:hypothetical protein